MNGKFQTPVPNVLQVIDFACCWRPRQGANKQAISSACMFQTAPDRPLNLKGNFGKFQTGFQPEARPCVSAARAKRGQR